MKLFALLATALAVSSAMAQSNGAPSDVPRNHWAFPAVDNLFRVGILKGYPDGSFGGNRPVSRYEMATSIDALFQKEMATLTGLQDRLNGIPAAPTVSADAPEFRDLNRTLSALRISVDQLKAKQAEMPSLTADFDSLAAQLRSIRESMEGMKKDAAKIKG